MQAREKEIDPVIGEDHGQEPDNGDPGDPLSAPALGKTGMQGRGIDKPGNQGPGFLRVPAPVSSPGGIRPDGAAYDPGAESDKAEKNNFMGNVINHFQGRQSCQQAVR